MRKHRTFVLDTNVLVDALCFKSSFGRRAFDLVHASATLALTRETFSELAEVLYRPRLRRYIEEDERRLFLRLLVRSAALVEPIETIRACRDPKDDKFLETAVAADSLAIISRDQDLLILDPFRAIRIVEPRFVVENRALLSLTGG